jgi:hypothetical protein
VRGFKLGGHLQPSRGHALGECQLLAQLVELLRRGFGIIQSLGQATFADQDQFLDPAASGADLVLAFAPLLRGGERDVQALVLAVEHVVPALARVGHPLAILTPEPEVDIDLLLAKRMHQATDRVASHQLGLQVQVRRELVVVHLELVAHGAVPPRLTFEEDHRVCPLGHHARAKLVDRRTPRALGVRVLAPAWGVVLAIVVVARAVDRALGAGEVVPLLALEPLLHPPALQTVLDLPVLVVAVAVAGVAVAVGHVRLLDWGYSRSMTTSFVMSVGATHCGRPLVSK